MNYMITISNRSDKIRKDFKESEFYSQSFDAPEYHLLDERLIDAAQFLREFYGSGIKITSSYRTMGHQRILSSTVGAASDSAHPRGLALDLKFLEPGVHDKFIDDIESRNIVFKELRSLYGIEGIGFYNTFIHLDTYSKGGQQKDEFGFWRFWDNRKKKALI